MINLQFYRPHKDQEQVRKLLIRGGVKPPVKVLGPSEPLSSRNFEVKIVPLLLCEGALVTNNGSDTVIDAIDTAVDGLSEFLLFFVSDYFLEAFGVPALYSFGESEASEVSAQHSGVVRARIEVQISLYQSL